MPASEAQIAANRANAQKSCGPRTEEGKAASRGNGLKHGLTARKLLPEAEAAEVEARSEAFRRELAPSGAVGEALARLAATMSVRMERCVKHENRMMAERVRRAEADFTCPEGLDEAEADRLRELAGQLAVFDDSKPAILARRYEADARRTFFRALKELRQHEEARQAPEAPMPEDLDEELGSVFQALAGPPSGPDRPGRTGLSPAVAAELAAFQAENPGETPRLAALMDRVTMPFAVGRHR